MADPRAALGDGAEAPPPVAVGSAVGSGVGSGDGLGDLKPGGSVPAGGVGAGEPLGTGVVWTLRIIRSYACGPRR